MATPHTTIRLDPKIKERVHAFCTARGINFTYFWELSASRYLEAQKRLGLDNLPEKEIEQIVQLELENRDHDPIKSEAA